MNENVCAEHEKLCDERFARDKHDIDELKQLTRKVSECSIKLSSIADQHNEKLKDHESRLDELESRPTQWWDKVVAGIIAAAVAYLMGVMTG